LAKELKPKHEFIVKTGLNQLQKTLLTYLAELQPKITSAKFHEWRVRALVTSPHAFLYSLRQALDKKETRTSKAKEKARKNKQQQQASVSGAVVVLDGEDDEESDDSIDASQKDDLKLFVDKTEKEIGDTSIGSIFIQVFSQACWNVTLTFCVFFF
jgi:hypothetical protein